MGNNHKNHKTPTHEREKNGAENNESRMRKGTRKRSVKIMAKNSSGLKYLGRGNVGNENLSVTTVCSQVSKRIVAK